MPLQQPAVPPATPLGSTLPPASATAPVIPAATPVVAVPVVPNYRVSLWDAMKFHGPAPETVNSRLAMLGFLIGAMTEARTGQTLLQQASTLTVPAVVLLVLTIYASMVPILKGAKSEPFGPFSPRAELVNGRAAMLGIAALLYLEAKTGVPFF
ncbi:hypothetical protein WJX72_002100 [[Myrmecia] bisecta]|uniref:Early light-induced protein n=1 Tax=[Myrmecia] bisecta TaxID=41462 RepID=A0AAW1Q3I2_9CHLO